MGAVWHSGELNGSPLSPEPLKGGCTSAAACPLLGSQEGLIECPSNMPGLLSKVIQESWVWA